MVVVEPVKVDVEDRVMKIFLEAIRILGGPKELILTHHHLTWLPALLEAAYVIILHEEHHKTKDEIASELGLTKQTVSNILSSDPEQVMSKIKGELEEDKKIHVAGGLAKLAYKEVKKREIEGDGSS